MTQDLDVSSRLQSSLAPGESLLWCGRPRQGVMFRKADALMIPFSVMWTGFAVFWVIGAKSSGAPAPFWSFGLIFVAIGLYLVVGRFFVDAIVRNKTYYGITRDRILILREGSRAELRSLNLRTLSDISITSAADGSGNISFGPSHPAASAMGKGAWPGASRYQAPGFELAENVQQVYTIVRDAQKRA